MNRKKLAMLLIVFQLLFCFSVKAEVNSTSFLETIFQAIEAGVSEAMESDPAFNETTPTNPTDIEADAAEAARKKAEEKLENILNDLTRIIVGKLTGVKIKIVVIPCNKVVPQPDPTPEPQPEPDPVPQPDPTPDPDPTPTPTPDPDPTPTPDPEPEPDPDPEPPPPADKIAELKTKLQDKYNVIASDGDGSKWSEFQLEATNTALNSLPTKFRQATEQIYRDKSAPEGAPAGAQAYVKFGEKKIHMLDACTQLSQAKFDSMKQQLGRDPTIEEQQNEVKIQFQYTLVHEMTHCFQNKYPEKLTEWKAKFWPDGKITGDCPTAYGKTLFYEDMAESVACYWLGGRIEGNSFITAYGTKMDLERYNFIKEFVMSGQEFAPGHWRNL